MKSKRSQVKEEVQKVSEARQAQQVKCESRKEETKTEQVRK